MINIQRATDGAQPLKFVIHPDLITTGCVTVRQLQARNYRQIDSEVGLLDCSMPKSSFNTVVCDTQSRYAFHYLARPRPFYIYSILCTKTFDCSFLDIGSYRRSSHFSSVFYYFLSSTTAVDYTENVTRRCASCFNVYIQNRGMYINPVTAL